MMYITKTNKYFWCALIVLLLAIMTTEAKGTKGIASMTEKTTESDVGLPDKAKLLRENGYASDTPEQIIEATKSESYFVRHIALALLTERTGRQAIPTLRIALNDERIEVRWRVAHLLGTLDDKSGLEQMRKDIKELAPNNGAPIPPDPNITDPNEIKEREGKRNLNLAQALDVAKVLAELGDRRGFELATRMAMEGPWEAQRYRAVSALVEMAKADKATLQTEGIDPVLILCDISKFEKNIDVFGILTNLVAENLDEDIAIRILEIAKNSQNQSEEGRRIAQIHLDKVQSRKKNSKNKS